MLVSANLSNTPARELSTAALERMHVGGYRAIHEGTAESEGSLRILVASCPRAGTAVAMGGTLRAPATGVGTGT